MNICSTIIPYRLQCSACRAGLPPEPLARVGALLRKGLQVSRPLVISRIESPWQAQQPLAHRVHRLAIAAADVSALAAWYSVGLLDVRQECDLGRLDRTPFQDRRPHLFALQVCEKSGLAPDIPTP